MTTPDQNPPSLAPTVREALSSGYAPTVREPLADPTTAPYEDDETTVIYASKGRAPNPGTVAPTVREDAGAAVAPTVREASDLTNPAPTVREDQPQATPGFQLPPALLARLEVLQRFKAGGAEADIYLVRDLSTGHRAILKLYRFGIKPKAGVMAKFERLSREMPGHVVGVLEHGEHDDQYFELLEYITGGNLRQLMAEPDAARQAERILEEMTGMLAAVHTQGVVHRDIKPENILIRSHAPLDLVLTDFGIASVSESEVIFTNRNRTVRYSPPESLTGVISAAWDWWSLGIIMMELLTGRHPFDGLDDRIVDHQIVTTGIDVDDVNDPRWRQLCRGLLLRDPKNRWGADEVRRWCAGEDVPVAAEQAAPQSTKPFEFKGEKFFDLPGMAAALAANWQEGVERLERGLILAWVRDGLHQHDLANDLITWDQDTSLSADQRLQRFIWRVAPSLPPIWKGLALSGNDLIALGRQAEGNDGEARRTLSDLYERQLLGAYGNTELAAMDSAWRQAAVRWHAAWEAAIANGAPAKLRPDEHVARSALLLGVLDKEWTSRLRTSITDTAQQIGEFCPWFQVSGRRENAATEELIVLLAISAAARNYAEEARRLHGAIGERQQDLSGTTFALGNKELQDRAEQLLALAKPMARVMNLKELGDYLGALNQVSAENMLWRARAKEEAGKLLAPYGRHLLGWGALGRLRTHLNGWSFRIAGDTALEQARSGLVNSARLAGQERTAVILNLIVWWVALATTIAHFLASSAIKDPAFRPEYAGWTVTLGLAAAALAFRLLAGLRRRAALQTTQRLLSTP